MLPEIAPPNSNRIPDGTVVFTWHLVRSLEAVSKEVE
jgi:hypothetical protein